MMLSMTRVGLLMAGILLSVALAVPATAAALRCLADFEPGGFRMAPMSGGREATFCLADPAELAMAGRSGGPQCRVTVVRDGQDSGVLSWSCRDGRSGRSEIRRDAAGIYTIVAQGIEGGLPWASRGEWRRVGSCNGR
jgi:hypothetical protein